MAALTLDVDLSEVTARLDEVLAGQAEVAQALAAIERRLGDMATQQDVDALTARMRTMADDVAARQAGLSTAVTGIRADVQALKDALAANQPVDLSSLEANVSAMEANLAGMDTAVQAASALDAENPAGGTAG